MSGSSNETATATDATKIRSAGGGADPPEVDSTPASSGPRVGTVLKGKYSLESKIGEGGMGIVFRAIDLEAPSGLTNFTAVKLLKPSLSTPATRNSFFEEVERTKRLQNEHIVDVYGYEQDGTVAFMVMEYLTGQPLDRHISENYALGMKFKTAWPIIEGMGEGLTHAHRNNCIHSDFKPSNVLVNTPTGAKILDFGVSRAVGAPIVGLTAAYASCEMLMGTPCDFKDDVYSFGLVVYKLLSGKHPFCDEDGRELEALSARDQDMIVAPIRRLTRRQNKALEEALRFDRQKRTASIQEVVDALEREAPPLLLLSLLAFLLTVVVAAAAFSAYQYFGPQDSDQQFLSQLLNSGAQPVLSVDRQTVAGLLDLGNQYLNEGQNPFNPDLLSENLVPLSCALLNYQQALKDDPTNEAAARGILSIVKAYKAEARRLLAEGDLKQAAQMTKIGRRIWPDSVDLARLEAKIDRKLRSMDRPSP